MKKNICFKNDRDLLRELIIEYLPKKKALKFEKELIDNFFIGTIIISGPRWKEQNEDN